MILKSAASWCCIIALGNLIMPTLSQAAQREGDSSIPALLQFAEQYNDNLPVKTEPRSNESTVVAPSAKQGGEKQSVNNSPRPQGSWQIKDKQIQQQQGLIEQLKTQLANLQKPQPAPPLDLSQLGKLVQDIRQGLALTPTEQRAKTLIAQAQQQWRLDKTELQQQLSEVQKTSQVLSAEIANQNALLAVEKTENKTLRHQQQELHHQRTLMQNELDTTAEEMASLRTELTSLRSQRPLQIGADRLKQPQLREDYAAGISLGEEMLQMQQERRQWGVNADLQLILAGITDSFNGKRSLTDDELNQALTTAEKRIMAARRKPSPLKSKAVLLTSTNLRKINMLAKHLTGSGTA